MSTPCVIAIKEGEVYRSIYNHHDGYLESAGITLYRHYQDVEKIKGLIALGNISSIGPFLENTANSYNEHLHRPAEERGVVSYIREGSRWKDGCFGKIYPKEEKAKTTKKIQNLYGLDFLYLYDAATGRWSFAYERDNYKLRDLEDTLRSRDALIGLFSRMYTEEYMERFLDKCLSAVSEAKEQDEPDR